MEVKFIEATNNEINWGKFMILRFHEEYQYKSVISEGDRLLHATGWDRRMLWVMDLQTREGAAFLPHGHAKSDLNNKHKIWVCVLFEGFLEWLYDQDLDDLSKLPCLVNLPDVPPALYGYRRGESAAKGTTSQHGTRTGEPSTAVTFTTQDKAGGRRDS